ncbi:4-alpha-glucanotransferase [uncultured Amnibacterium sp.]|uniref:4-alpha-glucanotransferase n=1 Tax=uncultured Amnibacterium sp. TaxID=1631851 RepID=UPI0035CB0423
MTNPDADLVELAHTHGVATSFTDWRGSTVQVAAETIRTVLRAVDVDPADPAAALRRHRLAPWRRTLPPCVVLIAGTEAGLTVHVPHGDPVQVTLRLEAGRTLQLVQREHSVEPRRIDGDLVGEAAFTLPADLPLGYHEATAVSGSITAQTTIIVTPARLRLPERLGDRRGWGVAAQLYSVRSRASWGVGDLTDLTDLAVWAGSRLGADFVLVNPLHAAEPVAPLQPSPYLPSSRRFFNPLYLRPERIPEYADLGLDAREEIDALARRVRDDGRSHVPADGRREEQPEHTPSQELPDDADRIDRDSAWTAKRAALRLIFAVPRSLGRELDLQAYRQRQGDALTDFAVWSAIAVAHGSDARTWPPPLRDPSSAEVAAYAQQHAREVDFAVWLQWQLDEQLQTAQAKAVQSGMALGTMHDLAVGVHPGGADAWRSPQAYAAGVSVGAPPDPFNQLGQNWRQPPWRPDALAQAAYAPFRDLIAAVLRHAGGVRVDHIIGLFRLWWVPEGRDASEGVYVRYDHDAMIGVLALEAHRAGAVVVGEDLGVVEPVVRDVLRDRGMLGTSILWFERDEGRPLPAERWREACLAAVTTHDLPPTAGYLAGDHVRLRERLHLLTQPVEQELAADTAERAAWLAELTARGLLAESESQSPSESPSEVQTITALHRYLTLTPARLLSIALTDAIGDRRTQNQPGTEDEYPNWRVPLAGPDGRPVLLDDVITSARAAELARAVRDGLRSGLRSGEHRSGPIKGGGPG